MSKCKVHMNKTSKQGPTLDLVKVEVNPCDWLCFGDKKLEWKFISGVICEWAIICYMKRHSLPWFIVLTSAQYYP